MKAHRYYGHKANPGVAIKCKYKRLRADDIEQAVTNHLDEMLFRSGHLELVEANIKKDFAGTDKELSANRDHLEKSLRQIEVEVESVFQLQLQTDKKSTGSGLIQEKLEQLANKKKLLLAEREIAVQNLQKQKSISTAKSVIQDRALAFKKGWRKSSPVLMRRLLRRAVDFVIFTPKGLDIFYIVDPERYEIGIEDSKKKATGENSVALIKNTLDGRIKRARQTGVYSSTCSSSPVFGGVHRKYIIFE